MIQEIYNQKKVIGGFKKDFLKIKAMGFVKSRRTHDTGIGKTFEDLVGIYENNSSLADYKGVIELKSKRKMSESMLTLFTKTPQPKGANSYLMGTFGYPDPKNPNVKILHTTINASRFNTLKGKIGFRLEVDEGSQRVFIRIKDLKTNKPLGQDVYLPFEVLESAINKKCRYIAYIEADSKKENGEEYFRFRSAILLTGLTFNKFIELIKKGMILYDIRIGIYRSGKNKGKTHDHGSGFRIHKKDIESAFNKLEL